MAVNQQVSVSDPVCMPLWDVFDQHPDFAVAVECRLDEGSGPEYGPLCLEHGNLKNIRCISDNH